MRTLTMQKILHLYLAFSLVISSIWTSGVVVVNAVQQIKQNNTGVQIPTTTGTPRPTKTTAPQTTMVPLAPTQTSTSTLEMIATLITPMPSPDVYFRTLPYPLMKNPGEWTVSEDGVAFAAFWEGFSSTRYDDGGQAGVGNCTIGYGHLLHLGPCNGSENMTAISQIQALNLLRSELNHCGTYVAEYTKVKLSQQQYDLMSGLVCGWGYQKYGQSQVLKELNQGHYEDAARTLRYTAVYGIGIGFCKGLARRRSVEADKFIAPITVSLWPFTERPYEEVLVRMYEAKNK